EEARARGIDVTGKLAILGFGGLESTEHTTPQLSTVNIDRHAIGYRAADVILERIAGTTTAAKVIDVGFTIVDRGTTCRGRGRGPSCNAQAFADRLTAAMIALSFTPQIVRRMR